MNRFGHAAAVIICGAMILAVNWPLLNSGQNYVVLFAAWAAGVLLLATAHLFPTVRALAGLCALAAIPVAVAALFCLAPEHWFVPTMTMALVGGMLEPWLRNRFPSMRGTDDLGRAATRHRPATP